MKLIAAALMISVAQGTTPAPPASPPPCVSRAELEAIVFYVLPELLPAVAEKCRPSLPTGSWLTTDGPAYAERLAGNRDSHWPQVRAAFRKMGGATPAGAKEADIKPMVDEALTAMLAPARISVEDCAAIDEAGRLLSPLPPENIARLASLLVQKAVTGKRSRGVPVCPA